VTSLETLIRAVDALEDRANAYVTLEQVHATAGDVSTAIAAGVLLVDHRTRADGTPVTLCRLNRRHPEVIQLSSEF
jgi:hypothetical protein